MPYHMLRSKYSCPVCNKKEDLGIKLFHVEGDGKEFYFCGKCLGEFKVENEIIVQTKKMETDDDICVVDEVWQTKHVYDETNSEKSANPDVLTDPQIMVDTSVSSPAM